jgi:hypothetical protein
MARVELASRSPVGGLQSTPVNIGTRSGVHKQGYDVVDTTGHTSAHAMEVCVDVASGIAVRYSASEWMVNPLPSGVLLIDSAIAIPAGFGQPDRVIQFTFNGESTLRLDSSSGKTFPWVDSDFLGIELFRAQRPKIRTWVRAASGTAPLGLDWYSDTADLQWRQDGNHLLDSIASTPPGPDPAYYNNAYYGSPIALLAKRLTPAGVRRIAIYGDSNSANADQFSHHERAIAKRFPYMRLCAAGAGVTAASRGATLLEQVEGYDTVIYAMGTNNLATPAGTLLPMIAERHA